MNLQENVDLAREREKELVAKLRVRMAAYLNQVGGVEFQRWKEECVRKIRLNNTNPDPYSYRLFNMLIGGSGGPEMPYFDFPGEYSIQLMIENLPLRDEKK